LLFYRNGTSSREWPAEMLFPDQSADLTRKSIKQKLTDICPFTKVIFIAPLKNVLFLFYLHSLVWIWTHLVNKLSIHWLACWKKNYFLLPGRFFCCRK
jgi:hypothetical protein